jgi:uncharacterized protein (TIGR02246 family)
MAGQRALSGGALADERALLGLANRYAQAVDRRDAEALAALFTTDGGIDRPGSSWRGHDQIRAIAARLTKLYASTFHTVRNQTVTIDGATAEGETYSVAMHMMPLEKGAQKRMDMGIRYQDRFVRENGAWLFARRKLSVDWVETTELPVGA